MLSWPLKTIEERIRALDDNSRRKAGEAFQCLMTAENSYFMYFVSQHRQLLATEAPNNRYWGLNGCSHVRRHMANT